MIRCLLVTCVFLVACTTVIRANRRQLSVQKDKNEVLQIVDGWVDNAVVTIDFNNTINTTGWSFLKVEGPSDVEDDLELAKAAGMAEGVATADLILMQWKNTLAGYCSHPTTLCNKVADFLDQNLDFMHESIDQKAKTDPFWYQVQLFLAQVEGMSVGYNSVSSEPLTFRDLFLMQLGGDLESLEGALSTGQHEPKDRVIGAGKCSALIKLLPHNSELFVSHDTWDDYQGMLRTYKLYDLKFKTSPIESATIPGHRVSFSSYPGVIYSGDDFYQLSSKLVTTETTFGNSNPARWEWVTPRTVMEGIRNVVANRLATSGVEWCEYFSNYNSGTYNNQWMIIDYNMFKKGETKLQDGLLWVLEQLPGLIHAEDQTKMLEKNLYWPSFNIPYYPVIYNESGFAELEKKYGSWFTWNKSPRAQIFARNHSHVTDMTTMINLMRYNNFQHDPLSRCNCTPPYSGENAISARSDLNPANGTYPFGALGHRLHGGTDNKVTSSSMMADGISLSCKATSGPTHQQQPVFQWSTSGYKQPHGHPDKWNFRPVDISWQ